MQFNYNTGNTYEDFSQKHYVCTEEKVILREISESLSNHKFNRALSFCEKIHNEKVRQNTLTDVYEKQAKWHLFKNNYFAALEVAKMIPNENSKNLIYKIIAEQAICENQIELALMAIEALPKNLTDELEEAIFNKKNNINSKDLFIAQIDQYKWEVNNDTFFPDLIKIFYSTLFLNKEEKEIQAVDKLNTFISKKKNNILQSVALDMTDSHNAIHRQKINDFAKNIENEFICNPKAISLANQIKGYVNAAFFNDLDIVKNIYSYLLPKKIQGSIDVKKIKKIISRSLVSHSIQKNVNEVINQWKKTAFISLKFLNIKTEKNALNYIRQYHLTRINLDTFYFNNQYILELAKHNMHTLEMSRSNIDNWPAIKTLRNLKLMHVKNDEDFNKVMEAFPYLNKISLTGNLEIPKILITITEKFPHIKKISLLSQTNACTDSIRLSISSPNVEKLKLSSHMTAKSLRNIIKAFPNLKNLHLRSTDVAEKNFLQILKGCPNLKKILIIATKINGDEFVKKNKKFPQLKVMELSCTRLKDEGLESIVKKFPNLITMNLSMTKKIEITDKGLIYLLKSCVNLKKIDLDDTKITGEGLIEDKLYPKLKKISLNCTKVTDKGLINIAKAFPNLETIFLLRTSVTDKALHELLKKCPNLKEIDLSGSGVYKDTIYRRMYPNINFRIKSVCY